MDQQKLLLHCYYNNYYCIFTIYRDEGATSWFHFSFPSITNTIVSNINVPFEQLNSLLKVFRALTFPIWMCQETLKEPAACSENQTLKGKPEKLMFSWKREFVVIPAPSGHPVDITSAAEIINSNRGYFRQFNDCEREAGNDRIPFSASKWNSAGDPTAPKQMLSILTMKQRSRGKYSSDRSSYRFYTFAGTFVKGP